MGAKNTNHRDTFSYSRTSHKRELSSNSIQCVLCQSISTFDPASGGINALKSKKRRVLVDVSNCPQHAEELCLFCIQCSELICPVCTGSTHAKHNFEALDIAYSKVCLTLQERLFQLETKREKLTEFTNSVTKQKEHLIQARTSALADMKEKFQNLRKLIDDKEKDIENAMIKIGNSKQSSIETEITKANERVNKIDQLITTAHSELLPESNYTTFLSKIEQLEEPLRHTALINTPNSDPKWYHMANFETAHLTAYLGSIKYTENSRGDYAPYEGSDEDYI